MKGPVTESGFTLTEVLVALVLFSISMLGISAHIANTLQTTTAVRIQANASELLLQLSEPLNRAAQTDNNTLLQLLTRISQQGNNTPSADAVANRFSYQLVSATDAQQQALLNTTPANWQAPYTVQFNINYARDSGQQPYRIPQTIVLAP